MGRLVAEMRFVRQLMALNLSAAMEYRAAFISQILGMFLNNGIYFLFWLLFFDRFGTVRDYNISEIYLLFGIVALGFGLGQFLANNNGVQLAELIAQGRLDYYLALPRPVLPHVLFSRMSVTTIGDISFGLLAYLLTDRDTIVEFGLFLAVSLVAATIYVGFGVITGSLAFYMGNARSMSMQAGNALITFALYPNTLFSGFSRLLLYTLIPAAFVGAVPVEIVRSRNVLLLGEMVVASLAIWAIASVLFYMGLRRYESGSAINVNV